MNSPRTKLHIFKLRHIPIISGQLSSFLAESPAKIDNFAVIDNDFKTGLNNV